MTKSTLFLDCDGTLLDTVPMTVRYINERYKINSVLNDYLDTPPLDSIINRYLPKEKPVTIEDAYTDLGENFLSSTELHEGVSPIKGVTKVIPLLAQRYDLWIVTARELRGHPVLMRMVEKHMRGCITGVHCVWKHKGGKEFEERSKRDFIARFPGEKVGFIDDSPAEVLKATGIVPTYLFDPHDHHAHRTDIPQRVRTWDEIGELFLN